jgi:hypothetical protein
MSYREILRTGVGVAIRFGLLLAVAAGPARAQGVTGTVAGTVKDTQSAVVPGATIILISQSKGTQSAPVVTNGSGDFVFPNIAADTYTIQVAMPSFKTLRRSGLIISPGSTINVGALTIEIGGTSEVVTVKGETPLVQTATGEKSFPIDPAMSTAPRSTTAATWRCSCSRPGSASIPTRSPASDDGQPSTNRPPAGSAAAASLTCSMASRRWIPA